LKIFESKRILKKVIFTSFTNLRLYKLLNDPLKILMYHRFRADEENGYVTKQSEFEEHINFLGENFTFVDLDKYIVESLRNNDNIKRPVAITVDDGYRNFYQYAFPVLKKYSVPATIFIPYNFIENGGWLWQDKNIFVLRNTRLKWSHFEYGKARIEIQTEPLEKLFESLLKVYNICVPLPLNQKSDFSEKLANHLRVDIPKKPESEFEPLTWELIQELEKNNVSLGSHTMNHQILTEVGRQQAYYEIRESKKKLEGKIGHAIKGFCFPNGNYNEKTVSMVKKAGYEYSVTTKNGKNKNLSKKFELNRICPQNSPLNSFVQSIHPLT